MVPRVLSGFYLAAFSVLAASVAIGSSIVDVSALDGAPERVTYRTPKFPAALLAPGAAEDVKVIVVVGLDGGVREIEGVDASRPELAEAARTAVRDWRFQSGYVKGLPTLYRLHLTVPFRADGVGGGLDQKAEQPGGLAEIAEPTVEWAVAPEYPAELVAQPRAGFAMVNLLVDAIGKPSDAVVEYATHPAFAAAARAAVLTWKFAPAEREAGLVSVRMQLPVRFSPDDAARSSEQRLREAQLSQARDYDVAPEVVRQVPLVYPYEALLANQRGTVSLNLFISPEGQVANIVPDAGTSGEFAMAAAACVACWTFNPATKLNQPVFGWVKWQLVFTEHSGEMQFDENSRALLAELRAGTFQGASPRDLDKPITPRERVRPEWVPGQGVVEGKAVVEVIIDENGRPQLPRVVSAPTPEVGYAAATAAQRWRFEPPRAGGKPAHVRVMIPFQITAAATERTAPANGE